MAVPVDGMAETRDAIWSRLEVLHHNRAIQDEELALLCKKAFEPETPPELEIQEQTIPCHNCQNAVSKTASYCPDCGVTLATKSVSDKQEQPEAQFFSALPDTSPESVSVVKPNVELTSAGTQIPVHSVASFGQLSPAQRLRRALEMDKRVRTAPSDDSEVAKATLLKSAPVLHSAAYTSSNRVYSAEGVLAEEQLAAPHAAKVFTPHIKSHSTSRVMITSPSAERIVSISTTKGTYTSTSSTATISAKPPLEFS